MVANYKLLKTIIINGKGRKSMYDLSNLNDYEFELLCKDIMQKKLGVPLHTFPRGKDGGIDICDAEVRPIVIIQAKHYLKSSVSQLISSLKKEVSKVETKRPQKYYVCTSLELTKAKKNEIVSMFSEYMTDTSFILDKIDINSFLSDQKNIDIVQKNYKLWFCASNILSLITNQNVFIDCSELIDDIENHIRLFVETESFFEAKQKLKENKVIIITGAPGVGKSTISKMLLLFFADDGYSVRYSSDNSIAEIKKALSSDPTKKEIILLDDFLGQHYLKIKDSQPNELKTLMTYIEKSTNKKLIMNSRITILNEAFQSSITFQHLMERHDSKKYLIDLDRMSSFEKAKILYNHLYFNELPSSYFNNLKLNRNYFSIIQHKNYNPRIIEYVTNIKKYLQVLPENYFNFILKKLDNPEDVWRDEFRNRLEEIDRILANTIYTLTDDYVEAANLEMAFNKRIRNSQNIDSSINPFKDTLSRLLDSILKNTEEREKLKVAVLNPSINDYLLSEISANPYEQIKIIENAMFIEQIMKVAISTEAIELLIRKIVTGELLEMRTLKNSSYYYYLKLTIEYHLINKCKTKDILQSLERANENLLPREKEDYGKIIFHMLHKSDEILDMDCIFKDSDKIAYIISSLDLKDVIDLFNELTDKYFRDYHPLDLPEDWVVVFQNDIFEKAEDKAIDSAEEDLESMAEYVIDNSEEDDIASYIEGVSTFLEDRVYEELQEKMVSEIEDALCNFEYFGTFTIKDFKTLGLRFHFNISGTLDGLLKRDADDYDKDYFRGNRNSSEYSSIIKMFER